MNERLKYEQLIGGKLQSLPVPDMQDAIWARVKAQLDLDMPTDDGDGGHSPQPPSGPKIIGWGLSVVIFILITIFFLFKNKPATKNNSAQPTTIEQIGSPDIQNNSPPIQKDNTVNKTITPAATGVGNDPGNMSEDSAANNIPITSIPLADDSVRVNLPPPVTVAKPTVVDTGSITPKRGRGVTGLNDSSYRIVPKERN